MELENSKEISEKESMMQEKISQLKIELKSALESKKIIEKKLQEANDKDGKYLKSD